MCVKITEIVYGKFNKKCTLSFSDGTTRKYSLDLVMKYGLTKGCKPAPDTLAQADGEQRIMDAKQKAYNYVSYKPRTLRQIKEKLRESEFTDDEIVLAMEMLDKFGLLDDRKFAINYLESALKRKPAGRRKYYFDMIGQGVDEELTKEVLNQYYPGDRTLELAEAVAEKKLRALRSKAPDKQKRSLYTHLQRKGFNNDIILKLLEQYDFKEDENPE